MNDSFVKIFNNLPKFNLSKGNLDTEKILMGWMKRILINTAIDELRRNQSAPEICELPDYIWEEKRDTEFGSKTFVQGINL